MRIRSFLTKKQIILLIGSVVFNQLIYQGARMIAKDMYHYDLTTAFDLSVPFLPWTVTIYWGCYIFWVINYIIGVKYDKGNGYRFILSHYIGQSICFIVFIIFPTTMTRGTITGNSIFDKVMQMTYEADMADNLLPSIHCFASWLCWIGVRRLPRIPKWYQIASFLMAAAVCISTLTVKQHVAADIFAGVGLAEISYIISKYADAAITKKAVSKAVKAE